MKTCSKCVSIVLLTTIMMLYAKSTSFAQEYTENFDIKDSSRWESFGHPNAIYYLNGSVFLSPPTGQYSSYLMSKTPIVNYEGDYDIELVFSYTKLDFAGSGIVFGSSNPGYPVQVTDPVNSRIFTLWQDRRDPLFGVFDIVSAGKFFPISSSPNTDTNTLKIERRGLNYNVHFNEIEVYSVSSTRNIRHVWFGNPGPADSADRAWNHMRIDKLVVKKPVSDLVVNMNSSGSQLPFDRTGEVWVEVRDDAGNAVVDEEVIFSVVEGQAELSALKVRTDGNGKAKIVVTPNALNNLRIAATAREKSAEIAFEVYRPKILIIPGHGASYNTFEVMSGLESENWHWFTDLSRRTWDGVIETLEKAGLQQGNDFEIVFYDWRKSLQPDGGTVKARDRFLIPEIEKMLSGQPEGRKVNILAHSFGGLVTRSLVEHSSDVDKVNRIISFGTPQQGSSNAYYGWEGGKAAPIGDAFYRSSVFAMNQLSHKLFGYQTRAMAMRSSVPSVSELMPTYSPYVYRLDKQLFVNTTDLTKGRNPVHGGELQMERFKNRLAENNILYRAVVSAHYDTIYDVKVRPHLFANEWEDGYAHEYAIKLGDNTVPADSAAVGDGYDYFQEGQHADLPDRSLGFIKQQFRLADVAPSTGKNAPRRVMGVLMFSPAYAEIYNSKNEKISEKFALDNMGHDYVYMYDFVDGEYQVRLTGTANGNYEMFVNLADESEYADMTLGGTIKKGQNKLYNFNIDKEFENYSEIVETSLSTIPGALVIRGSDLYSTLRFEVPKGFEIAQLEWDWVKVNSKNIRIMEHEIARNKKYVQVKIPTLDLINLVRVPEKRLSLSAMLYGQRTNLRGERVVTNLMK